MGRPANTPKPYYRKLRPRHELHLTGPCVIRVKSGRPGIEVELPDETKISHVKPKDRKGLTEPPAAQ